MSRPVQVNDYVKFGENYPYFIIDNISEYGIGISSLDQSWKLNLISTGPEKWALKEIGDLEHVYFISRENMPSLLFTDIKDLDIKILNELDEESLGQVCLVNRYAYSLCSEDQLWINRISKIYPNFALQRKLPEQGWRDYYLSLKYDPFINFHYFVESLDPEKESHDYIFNEYIDAYADAEIISKTNDLYELNITIEMNPRHRERSHEEWSGQIYYNSSTGEISGTLFERILWGNRPPASMDINQAISMAFGSTWIF